MWRSPWFLWRWPPPPSAARTTSPAAPWCRSEGAVIRCETLQTSTAWWTLWWMPAPNRWTALHGHRGDKILDHVFIHHNTLNKLCAQLPGNNFNRPWNRSFHKAVLQTINWSRASAVLTSCGLSHGIFSCFCTVFCTAACCWVLLLLCTVLELPFNPPADNLAALSYFCLQMSLNCWHCSTSFMWQWKLDWSDPDYWPLPHCLQKHFKNSFKMTCQVDFWVTGRRAKRTRRQEGTEWWNESSLLSLLSQHPLQKLAGLWGSEVQ